MVTLHTPHKGASRLAGGPRPRLVYSPYKKIHLSKNHSKGEQIALFYQLLYGKKNYVSVDFFFVMAARPGTAPGPWESKSHVLLLYERAIVGYSVVMTLSFHLFSIRFGLDLLNRAATGGL